MQIVFAGKAHPADETGKHHLQQVYRRAIDPMFGGRIAFVDDYDLHVAHFLVQGCDVWLNNPRKPLEASGTSGMKASINGVPHLSIGDGWWAEGYTGAERLADRRAAAQRRSATRSTRPMPKRSTSCSNAKSCRRSTIATRTASRARWLAIVRQAIVTVTPRFSARRMVKQYADEMYGAGDAAAQTRRRHPVSSAGWRRYQSHRMSRKTVVQARCALCGAKEVSEPRGEERYCRDCWDKKIAVEEIVAREFALKRYIRAHSAEKYLIYHSTLKRPCGQLIVVDDGYDLFLTMVLYPSFAWDEAAYHLEGDPEGRTFAEILVDVVAAEVIEPWGGGKWHLEIFRSSSPEAGGLERRDVEAYNPPVQALPREVVMKHAAFASCRCVLCSIAIASTAFAQSKPHRRPPQGRRHGHDPGPGRAGQVRQAGQRHRARSSSSRATRSKSAATS